MSQGELFTNRHSDGPPVSLREGLCRQFDVDAMVDEIRPSQYQGKMYGKPYDRPRLEAWFHDDRSRGYSFGGGDPVMPRPWTDELSQLRSSVEYVTGEKFDSCFVNLYRSGRDSIDWHADDESWIGPVIASVSLGATRRFVMKRKDKTGPRYTYDLAHGTLLVMLAGCQDEWIHSLRKTSRTVGVRMNLTFRQTRGNSAHKHCSHPDQHRVDVSTAVRSELPQSQGERMPRLFVPRLGPRAQYSWDEIPEGTT